MTGKPEPAAEKRPGQDQPVDSLKKPDEQPVIVDLINKLMGASFLEESDAMKRLKKVKELAQPGPSEEEMKEKFKDLLEQ